MVPGGAASAAGDRGGDGITTVSRCLTSSLNAMAIFWRAAMTAWIELLPDSRLTTAPQPPHPDPRLRRKPISANNLTLVPSYRRAAELFTELTACYPGDAHNPCDFHSETASKVHHRRPLPLEQEQT
jgi:hypothetical protein